MEQSRRVICFGGKKNLFILTPSLKQNFVILSLYSDTCCSIILLCVFLYNKTDFTLKNLFLNAQESERLI